MTTEELIDEALTLPVEERALIADTVLRSLNAPDAENDLRWLNEARRRLTEIRTSKAKLVPAAEVFRCIHDRHQE